MINCEINEAKNIIEVEVSGSLLDIIAETGVIMDAIYNGLKNKDNRAANLFETAMREFFSTNSQRRRGEEKR